MMTGGEMGSEMRSLKMAEGFVSQNRSYVGVETSKHINMDIPHLHYTAIVSFVVEH